MNGEMRAEVPMRMRSTTVRLKIDDRRVLAICLLYTSPSPRDRTRSRMPSSA